MENMVRNMEVNDRLNGGTICNEEVHKIISKLDCGKAAGWDRISAEHLRYAGPKVIGTLTWIYNSSVNLSIIPRHFKRGLLVPIPKPGKDTSLKTNNRGITLIPIFFKVFEKLMIEREIEWLSDFDVINESQSAAKQKLSCLHTSFLLQETIAYAQNNGSTAHGSLLDAEKAFDTVWIKGLLYKLLKLGINIKFWMLINSGYSNFQCSVVIEGRNGRWFQPNRGVHQGSPLSMYLYVIYINDLLVELRSSGHGSSICSINITSLAHADDIAIVAMYKHCLNVLLGIAYKYSISWRYMFSPIKTEYLIFGPDEELQTEVIFGTSVLDPRKMGKHMGIKLCTDRAG